MRPRGVISKSLELQAKSKSFAGGTTCHSATQVRLAARLLRGVHEPTQTLLALAAETQGLPALRQEICKQQYTSVRPAQVQHRVPGPACALHTADQA